MSSEELLKAFENMVTRAEEGDHQALEDILNNFDVWPDVAGFSMANSLRRIFLSDKATRRQKEMIWNLKDKIVTSITICETEWVSPSTLYLDPERDIIPEGHWATHEREVPVTFWQYMQSDLVRLEGIQRGVYDRFARAAEGSDQLLEELIKGYSSWERYLRDEYFAALLRRIFLDPKASKRKRQLVWSLRDSVVFARTTLDAEHDETLNKDIVKEKQDLITFREYIEKDLEHLRSSLEGV